MAAVTSREPLSGKSKTVLLLIETLNRGGIENVLLRLIPRLRKEGWNSVVVTLRDGGEMVEEYQQAGISVVALNQKRFLSPQTIRLVQRQVKALAPDLIMTNLFKADFIGRIFLRFMVDCPVVPYLVTTYNHPRYWIARVFEWLTKPLARNYIANSQAVQVFYEKHLGVRKGKIVVAPNGVDTHLFAQAESQSIERELGLPPGAFVVTCVANLAPNKGQADLLSAFESVFAATPKAYLLLVGDGEERASLLAQRSTLQSKERIYLLGRRTDVPNILKATTVFVLPTLFEGMSTALLEAMAAQKPIVTTHIPENKVLLTHNESALLVPPSNAKLLAAALKEMYTDRSLRDRLSHAAFAEVERNYSISNMATTFSRIFDQISGYSLAGPTKIIHLISSLESGGAENMLLRTLPLLRDKAFEQVVITMFRSGELAPEFEKKGIRVMNVNAKNLFDIKGHRRLYQILSEEHPGLVVTYLFYATVIGRLYLRSRVNAPIIPFLRTTYNYSRYLHARIFDRLTKHLVGHYFANSEAVKAYYVKHIGVRADDITVIPNGIDVALFRHATGQEIVREFQLPAERLVVSCVANLAVNKGHRYLLEAFERLFGDYPQAYLIIVGEGQERGNLLRQVEHYRSRDHILFLGRRSDVPNILAITDAFVLPTLFEGLSNALLEAMAAGCAVITTDILENQVIISHDQTGLLVPTEDAMAIHDTLLATLGDKALRHRLGRSAQSFIEDHFDLPVIAKELDTAFQAYAKRVTP